MTRVLTKRAGLRTIQPVMAPDRGESQLELFDMAGQAAVRPRRESFGRVLLQLRYDQLVLFGIGSLLGVTVVFAGGVERGKQLARTERMLLERHEQAAEPPRTTRAVEPALGVKRSSAPPSVAEPTPKPVAAPVVIPKKQSSSVKVAAAAPAAKKSRYAIQVGTYTRPQLAKKELDRLQSRGERAFLIMRQGRTVVYAGPFPSKGNASERLTVLRPRYQDCFLKIL